jgi:hypothetical protein
MTNLLFSKGSLRIRGLCSFCGSLLKKGNKALYNLKLRIYDLDLIKCFRRILPKIWKERLKPLITLLVIMCLAYFVIGFIFPYLDISRVAFLYSICKIYEILKKEIKPGSS